MFMLDTNICIYLIKQKSVTVMNHLARLKPTDVAISSITLSDLWYGVEKSQKQDQNRKALQQFLLPLEVLAYDQEAAAAYGPIRSHLERKGQTIGPLDLMIGAHALSVGAVLVTNNLREF